MFKVSAVDADGEPLVLARLQHRRMNADGLGSTEEIEEKTEIEYADANAAILAAQGMAHGAGVESVKVMGENGELILEVKGGSVVAPEGESDNRGEPGEDQEVARPGGPATAEVEPSRDSTG